MQNRDVQNPYPQFVERLRCPLCGQSASTQLYRCNFAEGPVSAFIESHYDRSPKQLAAWDYVLDQCSRCDLVYQRFIGDDVFLERLYGEWINQVDDPEKSYKIYARDVANPRASRDAHELYMVSAFLGKPLSELRTYDYGMGWGLWARISKALGCDSFGYDFSSQCNWYGEEHGICIVEPEDLGDHQFDFINTDQLLEHVSDPVGVAELLAQSLAPGGVLKIAVPDGSDIVGRLKVGDWSAARYTSCSLVAVQPLEHINTFSHSSLKFLGGHLKLKERTPSYLHRFAFLRRRGSVQWQDVKSIARSFLRPYYRFNNPNNLFVLLQR